MLESCKADSQFRTSRPQIRLSPHILCLIWEDSVVFLVQEDHSVHEPPYLFLTLEGGLSTKSFFFNDMELRKADGLANRLFAALL